ncbi:hypothetical protein [Geobacter sp. SVR]|uniref:hypothetical protein n=1 Tax=Geobacter sp. SVR TaxID=2495594 RepID=UPI00143F0142|nr:hypothetical protein [Geobacter sp. SVR]BCS54519.1 hypothetical protein GSVR_28270 [Geobacter sp. SVR]GCF87119.1 hypothetical protein GSbR_37190 [Geobacter sp. SVR]
MSTQAETYADINTALRELQGMVGFFLMDPERKEVATLIKENGLSRKFVTELAEEVVIEHLSVEPKYLQGRCWHFFPDAAGLSLLPFDGQGIA